MEKHTYEIVFSGDRQMYIMYIRETGEIRECPSLVPLFRTIVKDFGSDEKVRKG